MTGYLVTFEEKNKSGRYIPEAYYLKRNEGQSERSYKTDEEAVMAALADGISLIRGMPGIPDNVYVDTPGNRAHITAMLDGLQTYKKPETNLSNYAKERMAILEEFEIQLTREEESRLGELITEISVDHFMRSIFDKYL